MEITPKKLVICGHKLSSLCAEEYDLEVLSKPIEGRDNVTDMLHINCVIAEILDAGGAGVLWGGHVIGCLRRRLLDRWECIENAMIAQNHDGPRSSNFKPTKPITLANSTSMPEIVMVNRSNEQKPKLRTYADCLFGVKPEPRRTARPKMQTTLVMKPVPSSFAVINKKNRPSCGIATRNETAVGVKPRGIIGGRPRSDEQLKNPRLSSRISNASIDSILMPPPSSLAPRRSSRVRRTPSTLSHQSLSVTPSHTPITNQCVNVAQTTHFGLGCAAKSSKHMPKYYNTLGKGLSKCPHCVALLFNNEATGSAAFSKCCAKGRVDLAARYTALQERPACYEALFNNKDSTTLRKQKHLMEHVLAYNNTLSFGHVITQRSEEEFFRIVKCNNMIQYVLWDYNPPDGSLPLLHGQLFTIPPTQAHERLGEIAEQFELNGDLLSELHGMLRNLHPMAKLYETAAETFNQQPAEERVNLRMLVVGTNKRGQERTLKEDEAQPIDVQLPPDHMLKQIHPGRLQVETEAGSHLVAQFFVDSGQNVLPNMDYEVILLGRQGTGQQHLKWWRREIDPATFPLMFPEGQFGFEDGLPLKMKAGEKFDQKQNAITKEEDNKPLDDAEELGEDEEFLGTFERVFRPRDRVSRNQFFRYMAQIRSTDFHIGHHWLWQWGKLAQLYSITANNRMEAERVQYMKRLLGKKKLITPASIMNMLEKYRDGQGLTGEIGRVIMTDEHFRGSRQFYQKEFANCMTICREIGKPDLLITFTMDPECQELAMLLPSDNNGQQQQWYDRPDIVTRLFIDKLAELKRDLTVRMVMGPLKGWFYSVEHQKRGMPHVHICLILDWEAMRVGGKTRTPEDYIDEYICAEIPPKPDENARDAQLQRHLYTTVTTKNIHTCAENRCLVDGKCVKHFPKPYEYDNVYSENAYPRYRRRPPPSSAEEAQQNPEQFGRVFEYKDRFGKLIKKDNAHVVAYNPFLSAKYKTHINVEFVAGDGCVKYLCKYVMKGADMAFIKISGQEGTLAYDEYHQLRLARYITSMEAVMSMWGTPLVQRSHIVDELDVHGPEGHRIAVDQGFDDEEERAGALVEAAEKEEERRKTGEERNTQLTAYFAFNKQRSSTDGPLHLTYATAYKKLRYDKRNRRWQPYVIGALEGLKLCRLKTVSPTNMDLLAIRLLLLVVEDPTGWEDLRRHNGTVHRTFVEAAQSRGLLNDNELWMRTIREAFATKKRPKQCIRWLAVFFATANLSKPMDLFDYVMEISNTWLTVWSLNNATPEAKRQYVLRALEWFLLANGVHPDADEREDGTFQSACEKIGLPRPDGVQLTKDDYIQLVFFRDDLVNARLPEELRADNASTSMRKRYADIYTADPKPNNEQQLLVDAVFDGVTAANKLRKGDAEDKDLYTPRLFMVTGEGGAGKTFTYNKIIAKVKAAGFNFLPMATTGIAAELLYEGQTVHKRLCRQRHIDASTPLNVDLESNFAEMLRRIDGMIIDEISMQNRDVLEYVDRLLRFVVQTELLKSLPFGGKAVVIGGDWKQLTPVVPGGGHLDQYNASVKNSALFKHFTTHRLVTNHRLQSGQQQYRDFLRRVGTGAINDIQQRVKLPKQIVEPDRDALLQFVFPQELLDKPLENWQKLAERAILCPLNKETFELNNKIMDLMNTSGPNVDTERIYTAITVPIVDDADALQLENIAANINQENLIRQTPPGIPQHQLRVKVGAVMMVTNNISVEEGLCNGTRVQVLKLLDNIIRCKILTGTHRGDEHDLHKARFQFGGDPKALHEGPIRCERIQFPLRPGSVMTINKSQGQTLSHVGVLLDKSQCFSHGQLYTALSRVREDTNIRVCTKNTGRRVKNIVMLELLDKEDLDIATMGPPDDPNDPYPRGPPPDHDSDDDDNDDKGPPKPPTSAFKTPTTRSRRPSSPDEPLADDITLDNLRKIKIVRGDITKQCVDMLVSDKRGDTDNAILRACEPNSESLQRKLQAIRRTIQGRVPDGFVAVTPTYGNLTEKAKLIAHVATPNCKGRDHTADDIQSLQQCYTKSLHELINELKKQDGHQNTIAFPPLGTGDRGVPRDVAARAAFDALLKWLAQNPSDAKKIGEIRLVPFDRPDERLYKIQWQMIKRKIRERKGTKGSRASSVASSCRSLSPVSSLAATTPPKPAAKTPQITPTTKDTQAKKHLAIDSQPGPSQPSSGESVAVIPAPAPKVQQKKATAKREQHATATTSSTTASKAFLMRAEPDGICFFNAVCLTLFGSESHADQLRKRMCTFLRTIVADQRLFLRQNPNYNTRERFLQRIDRMLLQGTDEGLTTLEEYAGRREQDRNWAQINDSMLLAMLLQRPIVIITTTLTQREIEQQRPLWNDDRQHLLVYFPDGEMRQTLRNLPVDQLQNFTMVQDVGTHVDRRPVNNAIVLYYNGHNHFDTVSFAPRSSVERAGNEVVYDDSYVPAALTPAAAVGSPAQPQPTTTAQPSREVLDSGPLKMAKQQPASQQPAAAPSVEVIRRGNKLEIQSESPRSTLLLAAKHAFALNAEILRENISEAEKANEQHLRQHCTASIHRLSEQIRAATDAEFQARQQQAMFESIRQTPVSSDSAALQKSFDKLRKPLEELYNAIRDYLMLWQALRQIDSAKSSLANLIDWQKDFKFCSDRLQTLGEHWKEADDKFEDKFSKVYNDCENFNSPKKKGSSFFSPLKSLPKFIKSKKDSQDQQHLDALLSALRRILSEKKDEIEIETKKKRAVRSKQTATRRRQLDEPTRRRTSASPSKIRASDANVAKKAAAAAESRFSTPAKMTPAEKAQLQREQQQQKRNEEAEKQMEAKLAIVQQHLQRQIEREKNLAVRNTLWNREAKMEQRIIQRFRAYRAMVDKEFRAAVQQGATIDFEQFLNSDAAIRSLCEEILEMAGQDADADVEELMAKHQAVLEREQRALAEQQYWRDFAFQPSEESTAEQTLRPTGLEMEIQRINFEHQQQERRLEEERIKREQKEAEMLEQKMRRIQLEQPKSQQHLAKDSTRKRTQQQAQIATPTKAETKKSGKDGAQPSPMNARTQQQQTISRLYFTEVTAEPEHAAPASAVLTTEQTIAIIQPDPEAIRAREIIDQRLNIQEADFMEDVHCGSDDKAPGPHPNFNVVHMEIVSSKKEGKWRDSNETCGVCTEPLLRGDLVTELPCDKNVKHVFHTICLRRSLTTNRTCPKCRRPVNIPDDIWPTKDSHSQSYKDYFAEQSQSATSARPPDDDFVIRAWSVYEDLRNGQRDAYGSVIRQPVAPRIAFQLVINQIREGSSDFGDRQLEWDITDPRNDEAQGLHMCETLLKERMEEDEKEEKEKKEKKYLEF
ncbi:hypothetical protein niasHT_006212 [Heterodera trifolii]|uniref:ATP-dependent DNA helicase n=1 Tax=Heterodera trifolii TaxID=157864 RepID=A0ABD2M1H5_9BILA